MKKIVTSLCALASLVCWVGAAGAAISTDVVERAWTRIANESGMKRLDINYEKDESPNAWVKFKSANDFSVHVTAGLMKVLNSEEEIAGILGHEVGHVRLGHYNQGVQRNIGWSVLGSLLGEVAGVAGEVVGSVGTSLAENGFSREQEVAADDYGMDLSYQAGYDQWGLYNAMKGFKDNGFKTDPSGFNSHPPTDRRLKHLKNRAEKIGKNGSIPKDSKINSARGGMSDSSKSKSNTSGDGTKNDNK